MNSVNNTLIVREGVDGAIRETTGPGLVDECQTLNICETGEFKVTLDYNLPKIIKINYKMTIS